MKKFESLKEIELELRKLDLERQITKEQMKHNYHRFRHDVSKSIFTAVATPLLEKLHLDHLKSWITNPKN